MSPPANREEPLIRRLARSKAMNSRNASRDASMSPTRYDNVNEIKSTLRASSQPPSQHPLQAGSYYTENGRVVQYLPCTFIYPNNATASISLPSLPVPNNIPENIKPQRKLSKVSNLCWTTSVSQPDLTRPLMTPTMSPSNSLPTSRASSPVPPSISARGSPGNGPSPHVSPLGSGSIYNHDIYHLNAALNQLGLNQGYIYPQHHQYGFSAGTADQNNVNVQPIQDLNGNQAHYQHGQATNFSTPNVFSLPAQTPGRVCQENYQPNGANSHLTPKPDSNVWYCQYVNMPTPEMMNINHRRQLSPEAFTLAAEYDHVGQPVKNDKRCSSSSPQRFMSLSNPVSTCKKPCAVIAPHLVQNQTEQQSNQQHGLNGQSVGTIGNSMIRNSSPVPSIKIDNESGLSSSAPAHNQCWTFETSSSDVPEESMRRKIIERSQGTSNHGSCPDINYTMENSNIGPHQRSIGTSCSDLEKPAPLVVETCQICNLFHPQSGPQGEETNSESPHFTYSPCLYGHKVVLNTGISQMPEDEHRKSKEFFPENTNKLDNRPDKSVVVKYDRQCKVQTLRQETKENGKTEQIKSASGAGQGSIDNRIEQAMDLVKSHLMSAVRSEVEELRDKISKLEDTVTILSRENEVLRANVNPDVLASLTGNRNLVGGMNSISNQPPDPHPALPPPNQH